MTSILVPESSNEATSQVSKNESSVYDRFHRIDELDRELWNPPGQARRVLFESSWLLNRPEIEANSLRWSPAKWIFVVDFFLPHRWKFVMVLGLNFCRRQSGFHMSVAQ
jgi:hypothetical protein